MSELKAFKPVILSTACKSIALGIKTRKPLLPSLDNIHPLLQTPGASFVTLEINQRLRGCIGSLEPKRELLIDIASNAFAAAFHDPRFSPLDTHELLLLHVTVSVLSKPERLVCKDEQECLHKLNPGVDGVIISENKKQATFLPSVWATLSTPQLFFTELKKKAGFAGDYWSDNMQISRYTTEHLSAEYSEFVHEN